MGVCGRFPWGQQFNKQHERAMDLYKLGIMSVRVNEAGETPGNPRPRHPLANNDGAAKDFPPRGDPHSAKSVPNDEPGRTDTSDPSMIFDHNTTSILCESDFGIEWPKEPT